MSWLNLDSLNNIKGQITRAIQETVVQPVQEDEVDHVAKLESATQRVQELTELCTTQDQELSTLRRQILELQQQQQSKSAEGAGKSTHEANASNDESWFWDADNNTSSSSSKNEEIISKSPSGGDLTIIPLDQSSDMDIQERHQKRMEDVEAKVKKVNLENALLSEKVKQLSSENKDLNENIEELDKQHGVIVENLLAQKNQLQEKVHEAKVSVEALTKMKKDLTDLAGKHEKVENAYVASVQENITIKQQMEAINNELRRAVCENVELVAAMEVKNDELKNMMREKENLQREFQEFVVKMTTERDCETTTVKQLTDKIQFLEEDVQKSTTYSSEIQKKVLELSDELEREKTEKHKVQEEFHAFREAEMHKNSTDSEKLEDQELQEMKKRFPVLEEQVREANQVAEDAKRSMKEVQEKCTRLEVEKKQLNEDLVALQEDDLTLQRNFHALEQIGTEKKQLEQDFTSLQEEDLQLQRDYNDLKEKYRCLEEECEAIKSQMQDLGTKFQGNERDLAEMTEKCNVIAAECDQVKIERRQIEQDFIALQEDDLNLQREFHAFRNDNFQQLSEENNNLQRQIIDLQSKINIGNVEEVSVAEVPSSSVLELLRTFGGTSTSEDALKALEDFLKANQDTKFKLDAVEKRLTEAYAGVNQQKEEIRKLEHEKKTVQADLMHYEIECSELMKNNEILVQELEEIKSGKLETIQENSEEAVAMLEKQLEECNTINQGLENDIQMLHKRLDEMDNNQEELLQKIAQLEGENSQKAAKVGELRAQASSLESEKSNLTFELMELKVEGSRSQDIEKYQNELQQLKHEGSQKDQQLTELIHAGEKMRETLDGLVKEKNELINLVTVKHNESLQYHAEIQRLSQLLQQEMSKTCAKCPEFEKTLHDYQALRTRVSELEALPDQIDCLKEKSNLLAASLLEEQQNAKVLVREKQELRDKNVNLTRDLERLRQHLLSVEEDQTAQMVDLQRQTDEYKNKLTHLEQEAQKSSTAYTSASIRANQHAETLQTQYMLLTQQRDELSTKLSAAEDRESKNQAALINLQCALEQFQRDKDRDVEATTLRIRKHLEDERRAHGDVVTEVRNLQGQLLEAKTGLLAASRISDQLEQSQANLSAQKEELQKVQEKCTKLEQKLADAETNQADKVEKTLIKNLVIGYVSAPNVGDKSQILKLISAVLDFNQMESDRIGLKPSQAWGTQGGDETQGLAQAFVKFLEKESQPRQQPTAASLLNISHTKSPNPKTPPEPAAAAPVQPILLSDNILQALSPPRNSSTILKDILNDT
uniref:Putative golgi microtubule-associated protein n=1 Tax=Nyssomyia neivai TaxID=330878 RepID=A0A1L8DWB1_9DIPT